MSDKGPAVTVYFGKSDDARQLHEDVRRYAIIHGITHVNDPALGKAIKAILEQFFATDAARLEAGLAVECANCGETVTPGSGWIEFDAGGVCCHRCQNQAADAA